MHLTIGVNADDIVENLSGIHHLEQYQLRIACTPTPKTCINPASINLLLLHSLI